MSLFGQSLSNQGEANSPFSGLNLNPNPDPFAKRKSIFDASTSHRGAEATASSGSPFTLGAPAKPTAPSFSFGAAAATTSAPSLGALGTATAAPAPAKSLFGSLTTSSAPSPSPFGTTPPTTSQPASTPSLFGASNPQPAATPSLFGASNPQPAAAPSLFGAANPQQPAPAASGFGASQSTAAAPPPNTQAPDAAAATPLNRDAASFSSLLERQKKKPRLKAETNGRLGQLPGLNMDLGDLARRAQEIRQRGQGQVEIATDSRAHYLLAGSGVAPGQAYKDFQALGPDDAGLASKTSAQAFADESSAYLRDLRDKGRDAMTRESMDRVYREVDNFIEQSLGIDFEEQRLRIMQHFGLALPDDSSPAEGAAPSGLGSVGKSGLRGKGDRPDAGRGTRSVFGRSAIEKSIIGAPGLGNGVSSYFKSDGSPPGPASLPRARSLRDKERSFIRHVEDLNRARLQQVPFSLLERFASTEEHHLGDNPRQLVDAYHALREITKEGRAPLKEREYAQDYLDESSTAAELRVKRRILDGSRVYLEKAFWRELRSLIDKNAREAALGGQPSVINIVRAYLRLRAARRDLAPDGAELQQIGDDQGDYYWAVVFYLLRTGFVAEAADYVKTAQPFQSEGRKFVSYVTAYAESPDRRLGRKLQDMIDNEYQKMTKVAQKNSVDPYKVACYKVLGRCDLTARHLDAVGQGVDDWLWLQFNLAREIDRADEIAGDSFGLDQLRETVAEIGQKHFQKSQVEGSSAYGTYFFMQVASGMFEQAVEYLHTFNPVSAVHLAIGLAYYGLLRVSDFTLAGHELLTFSTTQLPLINFVPLVAQYTAAFRTALPVAAVDYIALICLNSDLKPANLGLVHTHACHECLRELCLETREFAKLLGDIRSDGTRIVGAIEVRAPLIHIETQEDFFKSITTQAAAVADQRGQVADAVLLYHLCEDFDNVITVLTRALADAVTLDLGESPMQLQPLRPRGEGDGESSGYGAGAGPRSSLSLTQSTSSPVELARNIINLYNDNAAYYNVISATNREMCGVLLRLLMVRAHLEATPPRYMTALEELNDLNLLPLRAKGNMSSIRAAATAFGTLPQVLARCAGVSVVWAVRAIGGERDNILRHGRWEAGYGGDADSMKDQLSDMAKDLMVFAGLIKYKLPARVYDVLTRVGGEVGAF